MNLVAKVEVLVELEWGIFLCVKTLIQYCFNGRYGLLGLNLWRLQRVQTVYRGCIEQIQ